MSSNFKRGDLVTFSKSGRWPQLHNVWFGVMMDSCEYPFVIGPRTKTIFADGKYIHEIDSEKPLFSYCGLLYLQYERVD